MALAANVAVALVALLHAYFLVLEMFLWDKPAGLRAFGHTAEAEIGLVFDFGRPIRRDGLPACLIRGHRARQ